MKFPDKTGKMTKKRKFMSKKKKHSKGNNNASEDQQDFGGNPMNDPEEIGSSVEEQEDDGGPAEMTCDCGGCPSKETKDCDEHQGRRDFVKTTLALGIGAVAIAVPVYGGARMALYPLEQTGMAGKEYPLTTLDNLDETPRLYPIVDTIRDAWSSQPNQIIGNVFIRKIKNGDKFDVEAYQTVCPHAGCRIKVDQQKNPKSGVVETLFYCPCHGDMFTLDGKRVDPSNSKSARDMDTLEVHVDDSGRVFVKFQNFRLGDSEKVSV